MAEADDKLRLYLGEVIPESGSDADTLFSDEDITSFLTEANNDVNVAATIGWNVKAANLAHLVDMAEGSSRRQLSQRWEQAQKMAAHFASISGVDAASKATRIKQIERA